MNAGMDECPRMVALQTQRKKLSRWKQLGVFQFLQASVELGEKPFVLNHDMRRVCTCLIDSKYSKLGCSIQLSPQLFSSGPGCVIIVMISFHWF